MPLPFADRLRALQSNVFADMDAAKARASAAGKDVIDLSLGSSDLPASPHVIDAIAAALHDPLTHGYALFQSTQPFRQAVARWLERRFGLAVDPETEVLPLIGSQEGTAHLPLAVLNPGDFALLLDPGYPSHSGGVALAGGQVYGMPLRADRGYLPDFGEIPPAVLARARLMVLSYPHNPTTATATLDFFREAVEFCRQCDLVLVHDFPYLDIVFEGDRPPSILEADRDRAVAIEFFTLSKSYNMGGFRVGYAVGNADLIRALRQIKAAVDFNQYRGILQGAIAALDDDRGGIAQAVDTFRQRRDAMVDALRAIGWDVPRPAATMYLWAPLPERWREDSVGFCLELVRHTGIALSPGAGFGQQGEGYARFALVHPPEVLREAAQRIGAFLRG